jgi:hypothetical protein
MCEIPNVVARFVWGRLSMQEQVVIGNRKSSEGRFVGGDTLRYRDESCANVGAWRCTCGWNVSFVLSSSYYGIFVVSSDDIRKRRERADRGKSVPDGVAGPQANPLRDGAVLLLRLCKLLLGAEGLLGLRKRQ